MESEIKGLSLRNFPIVLASLRGDDVVAQVLGSVSPKLRDGLQSGGILASGWYPVGWKRELHAAACKVTGEPGLARVMGAEMTKRDLQGVYRAFLRVVSPRFVLSLGSRIFSSYFRPGSMRVMESRSGFVRVAFGDCGGFDENIWRDVFGGCEATLEVAGGQFVRLHVESGGLDGDTQATVVAWWLGDADRSSLPSRPDQR
jgi:hypothetical protein